MRTTLRFHHAPIRMANIGRINDTKCWSEYGEKGTLFAAGEMRSGSATMEISVEHPQKSSRVTTSPISTTSEHIP